jgi:hypothetical protein
MFGVQVDNDFIHHIKIKPNIRAPDSVPEVRKKKLSTRLCNKITWNSSNSKSKTVILLKLHDKIVFLREIMEENF